MDTPRAQSALRSTVLHARPDLEYDTLQWSEHPNNPVIRRGPPDSWNGAKGAGGLAISHMDGRWWIFHSGRDRTGRTTIGASISVGPSPTEFEQVAGNPLVVPGPAGSWDAGAVGWPTVLKRAGRLWMYYGGHDVTVDAFRSIGLARSSDGLVWTKNHRNPLFEPGPPGAWDDGGVAHPSVIHDGENFIMAYVGWRRGSRLTHGKIGIATSPDGLVWTRHPNNPVLRYGRPGQFDETALIAPRLWFENDVYHMNYSGKHAEPVGGGPRRSKIGHAISLDTFTWTKSRRNPINIGPGYEEIEGGTPLRITTWLMFTTAFVEGGRAVLWVGW